ncbi:MAG: Phosphoenolpyruvate carboxylase [Sodalis sp.]|nr:MAG: Phosphoenolpyruvate carboxylase [Sodalis sp.]
MIGYSDSAKDGGVMAASWTQYRAQGALIKTCDEVGILPCFMVAAVPSAAAARWPMPHCSCSRSTA